MSDIQIDHLTQIITSVFTELGINPPFVETVLLRDSRYIGRKFKAGGYQAIWWVERNEVEVFDQDGQIARTIDLGQKMEKISA